MEIGIFSSLQEQQTVAINSIYLTYMLCFSLTGFLSGMLSDALGGRTSCAIGMVIFTIGIATFPIFIHFDLHALLPVAYAFMGSSANLLLYGVTHVVHRYEPLADIILPVLTCSWDLGSSVFLVIDAAFAVLGRFYGRTSRLFVIIWIVFAVAVVAYGVIYTVTLAPKRTSDRPIMGALKDYVLSEPFSVYIIPQVTVAVYYTASMFAMNFFMACMAEHAHWVAKGHGVVYDGLVSFFNICLPIAAIVTAVVLVAVNKFSDERLVRRAIRTVIGNERRIPKIVDMVVANLIPFRFILHLFVGLIFTVAVQIRWWPAAAVSHVTFIFFRISSFAMLFDAIVAFFPAVFGRLTGIGLTISTVSALAALGVDQLMISYLDGNPRIPLAFTSICMIISDIIAILTFIRPTVRVVRRMKKASSRIGSDAASQVGIEGPVVSSDVSASLSEA
ncbi:hypothetical protein J8273_2426 [Carpediemonas membranifera]|uniref:Uncharacterized protein n=1 Tax=Carpediemonas membranifera TaxID=201153 RepID=A0A8J6B9L6_9EUKA|nr:hypothetical protein J8273_2426 [Carpediemonas membranifera]|eukprot:KAG9396074.1 hypothetical protein J8273_2426 [Carpediemonas membranifera]